MRGDIQDWFYGLDETLASKFFTKLMHATDKELCYALSHQILVQLVPNWKATQENWEKKKVKMAYYFSVEFLMGRWLSNTLINLGLEKEIASRLKQKGLSLESIEETEADAALGSGGLGRLAACFLDSLATLDYPAMGYGIRYKYGMFKQQISHYEQKELPDSWFFNGDAYCICREEETVQVPFKGRIVIEKDAKGRDCYQLVDAYVIDAVPYDMPVVGYVTKTVGTLRLWQPVDTDGFDLTLFQQENYAAAVTRQECAENIARVLYPNDCGTPGKALRLSQQYFFVRPVCKILYVGLKKTHGNNILQLAQGAAIQINDTHPALVIPELMRLLLDQEKLCWEDAWAITTQTCAYTNHTIMNEAMEKWPIDLMRALLPRHYLIIQEINRRFLKDLAQRYPHQRSLYEDMSLIQKGSVCMAYLAIVGSHSVNGVASLHTEILKTRVLKPWYDVFPEKFNNKTNGITQRR